MAFSLTRDPIPSSLLPEDVACGAYVSFVGRVRDMNEGLSVTSLEYEAFDELALKEGDRVLQEAAAKFPVSGVACVHRVGHLQLGDDAIRVEVASGHRGEAFDACRWIVDEIKARVPIWKKEHYVDGESEWLQPTLPANITEEAYYARQIKLTEIGAEGQAKLKSARVLVIGAGGLGCAALPYLAAAGVGKIGICDFDLVQAENLARQVLFSPADLGKPKAQVAAQHLSRLNPFIQVETIVARLDRRNAKEVVAGFDIVLDCTDSLSSKFDVNEAAVQLGKTALIGGIYRYEGQVQVVVPGGPCLACLWPDEPEAGCVGTCAEVGVLGSTPGVVGSLMASETLKIILGLPTPLTEGNMFLFDLLDLTPQTVRLKRRPECTICGVNPETRPNPKELVPTQLSEYRVIDIREADERVEDPFPYNPSEWMPLSTWTGEGIDVRPTLFVCRSGVRSLRVVNALRDQGLEETYSLPGGLKTLQGLL